MVVIDQLAPFTGIRAAETFLATPTASAVGRSAGTVPPLCLPLLLVLGLLAPCEQIAGALQQLLLPLAHLDRVNGVVGSDLLDRLQATDRLHGDPGLELGAVGASLAHGWEPLSGAVPRLRGYRWALSRKTRTPQMAPDGHHPQPAQAVPGIDGNGLRTWFAKTVIGCP